LYIFIIFLFTLVIIIGVFVTLVVITISDYIVVNACNSAFDNLVL